MKKEKQEQHLPYLPNFREAGELKKGTHTLIVQMPLADL